MSNPMKDYVDNFRANLPSGVTFESVTARYFFNGKRFISEWDVERYREYIIKFGYSVSQIEAVVSPNLGELVDGETIASAMSADYDQASNYTSSGGTIDTVVASTTVNGSPALFTDTVSFNDVVSVSVVVTDSSANERDFNAGTQTVQGIAPAITAIVSPALGELNDGDQIQDGLAASATDPANYSSTVGTISSVVASVTINGAPGALTDVVATADEVSVEIAVTDSEGNTQPFDAGTQTVVDEIITATIEPAFAPATNGSRVGDLLSENALEQFNYNSTVTGIEDGFPFIVVTIDGLTESPFSGREYDLENYVFSEQTLSAEVFVEDFAGNSRVFQTNEQTLPAGSAPAVLTNPTIPEVPLPGQTITISNGNYSNDDFAFGGVLTVGGMPVNITGFLDGGTVSYQIPFGTEIGTVIEWQEESASGLVSSVQVTVVAADPSIVPEFTIVWNGTDAFIASEAEFTLEVT